jgi:hypothetical protein
VADVAVTAHELALVGKLLTEQAKRIREDAPAAARRQPHRLVAEAMADIQEMAASNCDELAERLASAVPGATIIVTPNRCPDHNPEEG